MTAARIVTREAAVRLASQWRAEGLRVVLALGVFDLLRVEHARALSSARSLGDRLVVAVHDDRSAASLAGAGRPVMTAAERTRLVAALRGVDAVLICDAAVDALARDLAPHVHVTDPNRGGDSWLARDAAATLERIERIRVRRGGA